MEFAAETSKSKREMEFAAETSKREKESMESAEALQADMLFDILSRASFETIERSKAVSKGLRQIINDPIFLPLHCKRTNSLFGYYFQTMRRYTVQSEFVSDNDHSGAATIHQNFMQILASCDHGILCCQSLKYKRNRYYVCKPATKQWQALPNPKLRYQTVAVALVVVKSHPLRYTIVRLSQSHLTHEYVCEIFDSKTWEWEKTQGPNLPYQDFITPNNVAVTVGESVYWLTINDNVLTLDLNERNFRCFPLPEPVNSNDRYNRKQLMKYDGGLGFTCLANDRKTMEIWVADGRQRCKWTRKMVVDMKFLEERLPYPQLVDFYSTDAAFMKTGDGAVFCNFRDCCFSRIKVTYDIAKYVIQIFRFRSDFETVDLKGPKISGRSESSNQTIQGVRPNFVQSLVQVFYAGLQHISKTRLVSFYFPTRIWYFISK